MSKKTYSLGQKIKWRAEVLAYDVLSALMTPFSFDQISAFGGGLLKFIGPRSSKNNTVEIGLRTAFPHADDAQIKAWSLKQWENTGRTFLEFPLLGRVKVFEKNSRVTVKGLDILRKAYNDGKGIVIVTGHFANWEIMAAVLAQSGLPMNITYRKINNPYMDARVQAQRKKYGIKLLVQKSKAKGARQLITALKAGNGVALMNDQKFNEGISVPFFGVPAMTAQGPTRMAISQGAPLIPISILRNGAQFEFTVHEPITLPTSGDRDADIEAGVIAVTEFIQDYVKQNPTQWFWAHRRWDKSHYKK